MLIRKTPPRALALDEPGVDALAPRGVGVVLEASHFCMMMRGVEKQGSRTLTSALRGTFREDASTRDQFLRLVQR